MANCYIYMDGEGGLMNRRLKIRRMTFLVLALATAVLVFAAVCGKNLNLKT